MTDHTNQDNLNGQGGIDEETAQRNQENETGQQGQSDQAQFTGQEQMPDNAQDLDTQASGQANNQTPTEPTTGDSGFVGSGGDQSSDYLTKGENEDFQPEDLTSSDTSTGTADVESGQPTSPDGTLDDGSNTSR